MIVSIIDYFCVIIHLLYCVLCFIPLHLILIGVDCMLWYHPYSTNLIFVIADHFLSTASSILIILVAFSIHLLLLLIEFSAYTKL